MVARTGYPYPNEAYFWDAPKTQNQIA